MPLLKVLYLDDELDLCISFAELFASKNVLVSTYTDALAAIEGAIADQPDIAFIDYRLPGTTGDQVAQAMPPEVAKYLVSGDSQVETHYQFVAVLPKPMIIARIHEIIRARLATLPLGSKAPVSGRSREIS